MFSKIFFVLLFISLFLKVEGQVTITNASMPAIGDTFRFLSDTTFFSDPGLVGGIYNFSFLKNHSESYTSFASNDNIITYPQANIKLRTDGNIASDVYFRKNANDLSLVGLSGGSVPLPVPVSPVFNGLAKFLAFPLSANSNISSKDSFVTFIPAAQINSFINIDSLITSLLGGIAQAKIDSIGLTVKIAINLKVLGNGKIQTPKDSNFVVAKILRSTTTSFKIGLFGKLGPLPLANFDVTDILGSQLPIGNIPATLEHIYYASGVKQPIISAMVDSNGNYTQTNYRKSAARGDTSSATLALFDIHAIDPLLILFDDNKSFSIKNLAPDMLPASVDLLDMQGQLITTFFVESTRHPYILPELASGIYFLRIADKHQRLLKQEKWMLFSRP